MQNEDDEDDVEEEAEDPLIDWRVLASVAGPGIAVSLAFLDPGNLESDLQSGAYAGYDLLWTVVWSIGFGLFMQLLAAKLGVVSGQSLAEHCRQQYASGMRELLCGLACCAILAADVQQILASAVALEILLHLPLWLGVLATALNAVGLVLVLGRVQRQQPGNRLETFLSLFILTMLVCFLATLGQTGFDFKQTLVGLVVPRIPEYGLVQAVGTLGATVMPHNLYLHSHLVLGSQGAVGSVKKRLKYTGLEITLSLFVALLINLCVVLTFTVAFFDVECAKLPGGPFARRKIDSSDGRECGAIGFADSGQALERSVGQAAKYIWAIGLLAASQASTFTGMIAASVVLEGYVQVPLWARVCGVRSLSTLAALGVAVYTLHVDRNLADKAGEMLNVVQTMVLPFAVVPMLRLTNHASIMGSEHASGWKTRTVGVAVCAVTVLVNFILTGTNLHASTNAWVLVSVAFAALLYLGLLARVSLAGFQGAPTV